MISKHTYKGLLGSAVLMVVSSFLLFSSYNFQAQFQENADYLSARYEDLMEKLKAYKTAEKTYQTKETLWQAIKQQGLLIEFSRFDLEKKVKSLSQVHKFSHVEMNFEEGGENFGAPALTTHQIKMRIKSRCDSAIYQFLTYLQTAVPGLFIFEKLVFERISEAGVPQIKAEISLNWLHTKGNNE